MQSASIKSLPIEYSVYKDGDNPVYGNSATHVRLDDESGGAFVIVSQDTDEYGHNEIRIDFNEVDELVKVINKLRKKGEHIS